MLIQNHRKGLRTVACLEAFKGAIVLVTGFGLLAFLGGNAERLAEQLVHRTHLNPANHYPQIFIHLMGQATDSRLWLLAGFALVYSAVRMIEAYGLWHGRPWAEWFAALSGGVYVPVELYELAKRVTWIRVGALAANLAILAYMVWLITEARRSRRKSVEKAASGPNLP